MTDTEFGKNNWYYAKFILVWNKWQGSVYSHFFMAQTTKFWLLLSMLEGCVKSMHLFLTQFPPQVLEGSSSWWLQDRGPHHPCGRLGFWLQVLGGPAPAAAAGTRAMTGGWHTICLSLWLPPSVPFRSLSFLKALLCIKFSKYYCSL